MRAIVVVGLLMVTCIASASEIAEPCVSIIRAAAEQIRQAGFPYPIAVDVQPGSVFLHTASDLPVNKWSSSVSLSIGTSTRKPRAWKEHTQSLDKIHSTRECWTYRHGERRGAGIDAWIEAGSECLTGGSWDTLYGILHAVVDRCIEVSR